MIRTPDDLLETYAAGHVSRGEIANFALEVLDDASVDRVMRQLSPSVREVTIRYAMALSGRAQAELDAMERTGKGPATRLSAVAIAAIVRWASDHVASNAAQ